MPYEPNLIQMMKIARSHAGLTQKEAAELSGIPYQSYIYIENTGKVGRKNKVKVLLAIDSFKQKGRRRK